MRFLRAASSAMVPVAAVLAVGSPQFSPVTIRPANVVPLLKDEPPFQVAAFHLPGRDLEFVGFDERKALFRVRADIDGALREYWVEPDAAPMAAPLQIPNGEDVEIEVDGEFGAAYVLYLPPGYSRERPPPLIFAFPPYGRGARFIQPLKESARRLGWVLVGCNDLNNGRNEVFFPTAREIMMDVRRRVAHDRRREVLLGFSGGAMGAYRLSRVFWDEFAGVVAFGGWLGVYEEHLVYPERLVVAMINGKDDDGARENEARDREILSRFGVTSKVFRFKGGHTIPPRTTLDQALDWMARQWASAPAPAVDPPGRLRDAVEAASGGRPREAVEACHDLILDHASSLEAQAAEDLLTSLLATAAQGPSLQLKQRGPRAAKALYGKARGASAAPARTVAYLEAGLLLAPDDGLIQSRLAYELFQANPTSTRARELAQKALATAPDHWLSHFVWGLLRDADGNRAEAASAVRKARTLAPNALQPLCTQVLESWGEP